MTVVVRKCLEELVNSQPYFISDQWLPLLVRQKALLVNVSTAQPCQAVSQHAKNTCISKIWFSVTKIVNEERGIQMYMGCKVVVLFFLQLASVVVQSQSTPARYLSNWLGRLRQIRHIKDRCLSELRSSHQHGDAEPNQTSTIPDFTQFA